MYLTQGLHRSVQQTPDRIATIFGDRQITFAEQRDRVARFAGALRSLGVQRGDRVAMAALNSDRYTEYFLAIPWADAMLNPVNIRWSPAEIAYSLGDSGSQVLLVDDFAAPQIPAIRARYDGLRTIIHVGELPTPEGMLGYEDLIAAAEPVEDAYRGEDDLAGLFYTGGTTGFPKGVMLSHRNLLTSTFGSMIAGGLHTPGGSALHAAPMFHLADFGLASAAMVAGNTQVMVPAFEPAAVLAAIAEHQVTDAIFVPTMVQMLVDHPGIGDHDTSSLQRILYGGSAIPVAVLRRAMDVFPNVRFTQAYGQTEAGPVSSLLLPEDHVLEGPGAERLRSGGRAAPHAQIKIVDADGAEVPAGRVGQILIRGGHVNSGYWNQPEESAAAVVGGWMHTGDGGRLDADGYLYIVDRIKDMIVTGGENVYSSEVENAVAQHPAVAAVAVIGLPDERWGERVHAVIVPRPGRTVDLEELRAHCKELIAGYKGPRSMELVTQLPMSGAGKVLKRELRLARQPAS